MNSGAFIISFIIFGMSGDLSKRKLIPALYHLIEEGKLHNFVIVGVSRENTTAQEILERSRPFIKNINEKTWQLLQDRCYYQKLDFANLHDYDQLHSFLSSLEQKYQLSGNRLFYLAAAAHHFCTITTHLAQTKLAQKKSERDQQWNRIVYEKPFGHNVESAHEINACIANFFEEHQIYRIDHYLTKELVSNIALVRFTNCVFEPIWNNRYIDQVQIILSETIGIENRGAYYDTYGVLCDVVQNHMMELLALIGMEAPKKLVGDFVRSERAKVIEKVSIVDGILGQYEGYKKEKGIAPDSKTETFAALYLTINNLRWAGVPFYLKTGKCLNKKETVIHIKFKQVDCLLARNCPSETNWLTFKVAPDATFTLNLNVKKPGITDELVSVPMEFCHSCIYGAQTPESYEVLLEEIMRGEQSVSVRFDEIEYAWQVIDTIRAKHYPLFEYAQNSTGPHELDQFAKKHGMRWRS